MDKKEIKEQLIFEVEKLFKQSIKAEGIDKLNVFREKIENTEDFIKEIIEILNKILEEKNINFNSVEEKNEFLSYMKPYINELIVKYIKN